LNGTSYTVIGVLPRHFSFPGLYLEPDLYGPAVLERDTTVSIQKSLWGGFLCFIRSSVRNQTKHSWL
jgi:hypothetical protein